MVVRDYTLVESKSWEDIRKKVYLPQDADEYQTSSRSLTGTVTLLLLLLLQ